VVGLLVVAHRGASAYEPENTLRAIERAWQLGADVVEVDVRATRDGRLVLMHDEAVDRTTNGHGLLRSLTLKQVKQLSAGGEAIPTLEEAIELALELGIGLMIEVKEPDTVSAVAETVSKLGAEGSTIFTSLYHEAILRLRHACPGALGYGVAVSSAPLRPWLLALDAGANMLLPRSPYVSPSLVKGCHDNSIHVVPWTVDGLPEALRLVRLGVDGLVTNRPDVVVKLLKDLGER